MSINREYTRKLQADIKESINFINEVVSKPYSALSSTEKYAIRYSLIAIAEALTALAVHIARRALNKEPETPIHALRIIRDEGLISEDECENLEKLIKLRNLLVHRYWAIDDKRIYDSIKEDFKTLIKSVERILRHV